MKVFQLTTHFSPNIGGVETHLDDLVSALNKRKHKVFVLTYRPLVTKTSWKSYEKKRNFEIVRLPWLPGFFYKFVSNPIAEFLYLVPGLFLTTPLILFIFRPDIIHSHGLLAGFVAVFWGKLFGKRVITTTHSIYHFPKEGFYKQFAKFIFEKSDVALTLSRQSKKEILTLGVNRNKVKVFTYWVDLKKFKPIKNTKVKLGWKDKFVVLFVGRLVEEKGILVLLEAAKTWNKNIEFAIIGSGPLESVISKQKTIIKNIKFLGKVDNKKLPAYYSAADLVIVPSIHEEGFGRVILESLACGTPVVAANRGAIPEAMDESVGRLIRITPQNIKKQVEYFYKNPDKLQKLSRSSREFAENRYSEKNVDTIVGAYDRW